MTSNHEINFGPVFMRGRKPASGSTKTIPTSAPQSTPAQTSPFQNHQPTGVPAPVLKSQVPTLGSFSPATTNPSLSMSKSFSAVVSPGRDSDDRQPNGWDNTPSNTTNTQSSASPVEPSHSNPLNGSNFGAGLEYSREALLSIYSDELRCKLPPDLEVSDPAVTTDSVGPPLALIEMSEAEKELFSGSYNSERRPAPNKLQHQNTSYESPLTTPLSPDGGNPPSAVTKLPLVGAVKLAKHNSVERFTSLGIQGGVLSGVASTGSRRRAEGENEPMESPRRVVSQEDPPNHSSPWSANPRDRRPRDSGPPAEGMWKRGLSLEEKAQQASENVNNTSHSQPKYSVLEKMREKGLASSETAPRESSQLSLRESRGHTDGPWKSSGKLLTEPDQPTENLYTSSPLPVEEPQLAPAPSSHSESRTQSEAVEPEPKPQNESQDQSPPVAPSEPQAANPPSLVDSAPEDIAWQYRDPSGTVQGPFTAFQMQEWYKASFFRDDLLVKRLTDPAFETLETLILRVGDRDRPFSARPPPTLPPNLPLPAIHMQHLQHSGPVQPSPSVQLNSLLGQVGSLSSQTEGLSISDSPLPNHSNSTSNPLSTSAGPDPWGNLAPSVASPLGRPHPLVGSSPVASGTPWTSAVPSYSPSSTHPANDFAAAGAISNGLLPNAYAQPDALRYLQHMQLPGLSMATANGYSFPIPLPQQPNFGQIPAMHHLGNNPGLDPLLVSQLQPQLNIPITSYNLNPATGLSPAAPEIIDLHPERDPNQAPNSAQNVLPPADPWNVQSEISRASQLSSSQLSNAQYVATPAQLTTNEPSAPHLPDLRSNNDASVSLEPIGTRSSGKNTPISPARDLVPVIAVNAAPQTASQDPPLSATEKTQKPLPEVDVPPSKAKVETPVAPISAPEGQPTSDPQDSLPKSLAQGDSTAPVTKQKSLSVKVSAKASPPTADQSPIASSPDQSRPANNNQLPAKASVAQTVNANPASKQSSKVVVLTRAQQDEQDRRTASIQKTQLQLKEAQAVERAAREASEAAAAAALASFSTPAPWSKEEKVSGANLSLTEIQALETKQAEKRRLAEKQVASNRAMAEQAAPAHKAAKEALSPSSNWATSSNLPSKPNLSATVWGSKEVEGNHITSAPKQSMKQIQEEEARKKKLALQQQAKAASAAAKVGGSGGYAGTVAASGPKPAVGGPWSVVGPKSKVVAPPPGNGRTAAAAATATSVVPGLSSTVNRAGVSNGTSVTSASGNSALVSSNKPQARVNPPTSSSSVNPPNSQASNLDGPPPASPEFMKWLREALRGMNNVEDFVKMLLDFPINPDESVLEIVSDSVYAGSATLDGRRFAKEFNMRRQADVYGRMVNNKQQSSGVKSGGSNVGNGGSGGKKGSSNSTNTTTTTMAEALKFTPAPKNDGWGFAVVGAKKKKK